MKSFSNSALFLLILAGCGSVDDVAADDSATDADGVLIAPMGAPPACDESNPDEADINAGGPGDQVAEEKTADPMATDPFRANTAPTIFLLPHLHAGYPAPPARSPFVFPFFPPPVQASITAAPSYVQSLPLVTPDPTAFTTDALNRSNQRALQRVQQARRRRQAAREPALVVRRPLGASADMSYATPPKQQRLNEGPPSL